MGMGTSNVIATLRNLDVVHGLEWAKGYITSNGSLVAPNVTEKEVTTLSFGNPFDSTTEVYVVLIEYPDLSTKPNGAASVGYYNGSTWLGRQSVSCVANWVENARAYSLMYFAPQYTSGEVRITIRTFGKANSYIFSLTDFMTQVIMNNGIIGTLNFNDL